MATAKNEKIEAPEEEVAEVIPEAKAEPAAKESHKATPKKKSPMELEIEHLAPYEDKILHNNIRVVLHIGPEAFTEERVDLPFIADGIKAQFK